MRPASRSSAGPNVGKSSLVNRLLREERVLVSDMPGTTRDAIDAVLTWHRRQFRIVDTAGMRRPGRVRARRQGGGGQRRRREAGDRRRRRRRARDRRQRRRHRSGRGDRRGSRSRRPRHRHRREQVGSREGARPRLRRRCSTRKLRQPHEVPGLRADPAHLGADRRADGQGARDDRQDRRRRGASAFRRRRSTSSSRR